MKERRGIEHYSGNGGDAGLKALAVQNEIGLC
jgi:hypothetical protein